MNDCCKDEKNLTHDIFGRPPICTVCGTKLDGPVTINPHGDLSLTLKRSAWENLFLVLGEKGLGRIGPERQKLLHKQGVDPDEFRELIHSNGNFWAAIQVLQAQFETLTGEHPKTHY